MITVLGEVLTASLAEAVVDIVTESLAVFSKLVTVNAYLIKSTSRSSCSSFIIVTDSININGAAILTYSAFGTSSSTAAMTKRVNLILYVRTIPC